ncbi:MAG: putative RNA polymerase sigma factor [Bacteroidia bacterium]|nr:MAG: putative RNA polymerase sigma factor [Bacteroidia bacterium]
MTNYPQDIDIKLDFKNVILNSYKKFYTHACIQLGCKETAKDIVQESILTAYEKLHQFEGKSSLETWIFAILNNKILQHFRSKQREQKHLDFDSEKLLFNKNGSWNKKWVSESLFEIEQKESQEEKNKIWKFLVDCLNALKEQHKQIVLFKFYFNKSTRQICEECNVSEDNVWQIIHRSKLQLKVCLQSKIK